MASFLDMIRAMNMIGERPRSETPTANPMNTGRMGPNAGPAPMRRRMANGSRGSRTMQDVNYDGDPNADLAALLLLMQQGTDAGFHDRPMGPSMRPDAGDLYDYNYSDGDPGLSGLFGSTLPPLRQPPPGVTRRRGY